MTLSEDLHWRGLIHQTTLNENTKLNTPRIFYLGVDPSSDSMTIGNLAVVLLVRRLIEAGHTGIMLVGGATGMIGDPKETAERTLKSVGEISRNKEALAKQFRQLLANSNIEVVDNYQWFKDIQYIDFLREIGKNFSMSQLLDRDFVKKRTGTDGQGLSYAEFSYSLIQGYDFLHLFREKNVTLQIGASDQWGNMLSGAQLVRQMTGKSVDVLTMPLVINAETGQKFGKTEDGAIWLDSSKTSVYTFYQFWFNVPDDAVADYLKIYTFLSKEEIESIVQSHVSQMNQRTAQKRLAYEVTAIVHGEEAAKRVEKVTDFLFAQEDQSDVAHDLIDLLKQELSCVSAGIPLLDALQQSGVASSKGEARRLVHGGAITIHGQRADEHDITVTHTVIKKGKNTFLFVA